MVQPEEQWQATMRYFSRVVDRLGTHIDPKIMDTVVAFNVVGIRTVASCAGHLDRAAPYPWIDLEPAPIEELSQMIVRLLHAGERDAPETEQLQHQRRLLYLDVEQKVIALLNAFYQQHQMDYDRHLTIERFANGMPRLQSFGAAYQEFRTPEDRTAKLAEYQDEMQAFT